MIKIQIKKIQQIQSKCGFIRTGHGLIRTGWDWEINLADLSEKSVLSPK